MALSQNNNLTGCSDDVARIKVFVRIELVPIVWTGWPRANLIVAQRREVTQAGGFAQVDTSAPPDDGRSVHDAFTQIQRDQPEMIYIEFIERDRFMPVEIFRLMGDQSAWADPDDTLFANLARTMRIGPHPANMAFWKCRGLERMDEWEVYFRSDAGLRDIHEQATHRAINLKDAGCYDELVEGPQPSEGLQYIEFFDFDPDVSSERIAAHITGRAEMHAKGTLNLVVRRIGLLGPSNIGDMAVWTFPNYADAEPIFRERHVDGAMRPTQAGVYRSFGQEIL